MASEPLFFEPKARRKEHGGISEATATSLDRSFVLEMGQRSGGVKTIRGVRQPLACASGFHESAMPVLGAPVSFMYDPAQPVAGLS